MNGSWAMTFISNARARRATSWPMRPETGEAERLAAHFFAEETLLVPLALLHRRVGGRNFSGKCQQLRHRQFRDADAVGARRVHHDDAARAGGVDVDVVDAGAGARDGAQLRRGRNQIGGHFRGAAHDDRVGVGEIGGEFGGRPAAARVNVPAFGAEQVESGRRAGRRRR